MAIHEYNWTRPRERDFRSTKGRREATASPRFAASQPPRAPTLAEPAIRGYGLSQTIRFKSERSSGCSRSSAPSTRT